MFTGAINLLPGQELRTFTVLRDDERRTGSGRITMNGAAPVGEIKAILAAAKPAEIERWRQLEHPVTHKIIQKGVTPFPIRPGDYIVRGEKRYIVRTAPYNPGGINHWTIYYCQERSDA